MKKLLISILSIIALSSCQKEVKTAFVKTETIFKEYKGSKDQEAYYKKQEEAFTKKYDSIVQEWQSEVVDFQKKMKRMSPAQVQKKNQELYNKQQVIQQMRQQERAQLNAEFNRKTDSLIKKVYDFFDAYGNKNGYQYIYGKNNTGALMYGNAQNDITDAVLKELNATYDAEKK